jgi:antitoxin (DNA-binding transcriptional repressor) of toxin-antitoxin stability system
MSIVNLLEARFSLSRPVESVECDAEREVIMVHNGKPAARLVAVGATVTGK